MSKRVVYATRTSGKKIADSIVKILKHHGYAVGVPARLFNMVHNRDMYVFSVANQDDPWGAISSGARILVDPKTFDVLIEDQGEISLAPQIAKLLAP